MITIIEMLLPTILRGLWSYLDKKGASEKTKLAYRNLVMGLASLQRSEIDRKKIQDQWYYIQHGQEKKDTTGESTKIK